MDITLDDIVLKKGMREAKLTLENPKYKIPQKLSGYGELYSDSTLDDTLKILTDSLDIMECLSDKLKVSRMFPNEMINTIVFYIASEYALSKLNGYSDTGGSKSINLFSRTNLNLSLIYPGPREEALTIYANSINRGNGMPLSQLNALFFQWMQEQSLSYSARFNEDQMLMAGELNIQIGQDFKIKGFQKPYIMPQLKTTKVGEQKLSWLDFGGYPEVVDYFKFLALKIKHFDFIKDQRTLRNDEIIPKGILIYGPPGTGKTTLSRILCREAGVPYFEMSAADIADRYQFGPTKLMEEKFEESIKAITHGGYKASIMFLDECETYLGKRTDSNNKDDQRLVATFNTYTDGARYVPGLMIIGATNYPELIDGAVLRRLRDGGEFYLGPPDPDTLRKIFDVHLSMRKSELTVENVEYLISNYGISEGGEVIWTGSHVTRLIKNTYSLKLKTPLELLDKGELGKADFDAVPKLEDFINYIENYGVG